MRDKKSIDDSFIPLSEIISNTGNELGRLTSVATRIDDHIGDLFLHPELAAKLSTELMQDVDCLRQAIDCLHRLMKNIAKSGHADGLVSLDRASDGVYLESVRTACLRPEEGGGVSGRDDAA